MSLATNTLRGFAFLCKPDTGLPDFERMSDREFSDFAHIAPEHSIITTDLGQVGMPHPVEGMRRCIIALLKNDLSQKQVDYMIRSNPAMLVGLPEIK